MKVFHIPNSELTFSFSRSSGAGGQNVNKVETRVTISWNFKNSSALTNEQKIRIATKLKNRIDNIGELSVSYDKERSQVQNRNHAIERLQKLITQALIIPKTRKPTKIPLVAHFKRLTHKAKHARKKTLRRTIAY